MGEVGRWIRAQPGAAGSEGVCLFALQTGVLPPAFGTPLINAGGKKQKRKTARSRCSGLLLCPNQLWKNARATAPGPMWAPMTQPREVTAISLPQSMSLLSARKFCRLSSSRPL